MITPLPLKIQLVAFALLVVTATAVWFVHDQVYDAVAALTGKGRAGNGQEELSDRRRNDPAIPVVVAPITAASNDESIFAIGSARGQRHIMLRAKADGQLMEFPPRAGDRVKAGQLIFRLDTTQAELALKLAEKRLEDAEMLLNRQLQLQERQVSSSAKVADYQLDRERAKLELLQAQKSLQDLSIRAPFAGVVGLPSAEVGERVTTTTDLASLDDRDKLLVEFKVPERYATRIKRSDTFQVETPSLEGRRFTGHIEYIDSRIATETRTVKVRGVIPNDKDILRPGMSFAVEMVLTGQAYPAVPELSLQWRNGESFIWVVRAAKAENLVVRTVQRQSNRVLIDAAVEIGELVVVEGVQRLRDGLTVEYDLLQEPEQRRTLPGKAAERRQHGAG